MKRMTVEKFAKFKDLHKVASAFVMPNAWDAGSAIILSALGYSALATTSAGLAFSLGQRDSYRGLTRQQILDNASAIVTATDLPVSADLEEGFGEAPEACAETVVGASEIGLVGGSIEDATGDSREPIFSFTQAVERVAAAAEASQDLPFLLTARAENHIYGRIDLDDTIRRLQAYANAGADVLYAPGLPSLAAIKTVCDAVDKPVNIVMGLQGVHATVTDLQSAGVTRISVGGSFARAAMGAFIRAAKEVREFGSFEYAADAISDADAAAFMRPIKRPINGQV